MYRLYQPVVQQGRWTHGLIEMWCEAVVGGVPHQWRWGDEMGMAAWLAAATAKSFLEVGMQGSPLPSCRHLLQVFQAQAGQAQRAHPLLGFFQVEPAHVAGALLWAVSSLPAPAPERVPSQRRRAAIPVPAGGTPIN